MNERKLSVAKLKTVLYNHAKRHGLNPIIVDAKPSPEGFPAIMIGKVFRIEITDHHTFYYRLFNLTKRVQTRCHDTRNMDETGRNVSLAYLKSEIVSNSVHVDNCNIYSYTDAKIRKFIEAGLCSPREKWFDNINSGLQFELNRVEKDFQKEIERRVKFFGPPNESIQLLSEQQLPAFIPDAHECKALYSWLNAQQYIVVEDHRGVAMYCVKIGIGRNLFCSDTVDYGCSIIVETKMGEQVKFFSLNYDWQTRELSVRGTSFEDRSVTPSKHVFCKNITAPFKLELHP